ncbi:AMP-binding protein [Kitasatospora indigofera]|uniref:AMP-binding protein n=1 Tax=Kitasatospora indigofera TaxID=67307 RepID=UPI003661612A
MYGDDMYGNGSGLVYRCVDRHVEAGLGDRVAIHFEGGPGGGRSVSYARLQQEVARAAEALAELGTAEGDQVAVRAAATPETVVAVLACARIGAVPVPSDGPSEPGAGGAAGDVLAVRRRERAGRAVGADTDCGCGCTRPAEAGEGTEGTEAAPAGGSCAGASASRPPRAGQPRCGGPESGRTARAHPGPVAPGRRRTGAAAPAQLTVPVPARRVVPAPEADVDVYWSRFTDGWGSGLPEGVRGPLAAGATQVIHTADPEGLREEELWETVQRYGVSVLYTTPEDIRTLMLWGDELGTRHDLSSLRILGTVGARSGTEGWIWYRDPDGADGLGAEDGGPGGAAPWELRTCSTPWAAPAPGGRRRLYVVR